MWYSIADLWVRKHLPGEHNQKDHGGNGHGRDGHGKIDSRDLVRDPRKLVDLPEGVSVDPFFGPKPSRPGPDELRQLLGLKRVGDRPTKGQRVGGYTTGDVNRLGLNLAKLDPSRKLRRRFPEAAEALLKWVADREIQRRSIYGITEFGLDPRSADITRARIYGIAGPDRGQSKNLYREFPNDWQILS